VDAGAGQHLEQSHGNQNAESNSTAGVAQPARGAGISVRDEGQGFDPTRLPDPLAPENLYRTSGRGFLLMNALMDTVAFRRPATGGMEVTMRKRLWSELESAPHSSPIGAVAV
jgi:serine/threonine-protein kinase RsbW